MTRPSIDRACISISEKCNMDCRYCHFSKDGKRGMDMGDEEVLQIINNVIRHVNGNNMHSFKIGIVGGGEPTLRLGLLKKIVESVKRCAAIKLYTISNGLGISDETLRFFHENEAVIALNISLDGPARFHDKNRVTAEGTGTFDEVMSTLGRYSDLFGHMPSVNCTVSSEHIENADETIDFFTENKIHNVTFSRLFEHTGSPSENDFDDFLRRASKKLNLRQMRAEKEYDCRIYGKLCGVGRTNVYFASGSVYPCGRFAGRSEYILGKSTDELPKIESTLSKIVPAPPGTCFFDNLQGVEIR